LPNETHISNFISDEDVIHVFGIQLKKVKKDVLVKDQTSWKKLKNYIINVVLIMIRHYVKLNIDRTQYNANTTTSSSRTEWQNPILVDLHNLDRKTVDIVVMCEGGTNIAKEIDVKTFMDW
jgi:hypothetical protein